VKLAQEAQRLASQHLVRTVDLGRLNDNQRFRKRDFAHCMASEAML